MNFRSYLPGVGLFYMQNIVAIYFSPPVKGCLQVIHLEKREQINMVEKIPTLEERREIYKRCDITTVTTLMDRYKNLEKRRFV